MNKTIISWTKATWNPVHGCTRVSEGCRHCYAEALSLRRGWTKSPWTKQNEKENVILKPHKLRDPYSLKEPSKVFVNSMSDLFHDLIPDWYRAIVFTIMADLPQHSFQVLTKRPQNTVDWPARFAAAKKLPEFKDAAQKLKLSGWYGVTNPWADNIWMGTSIEDARALKRLDHLRACEAKIRFVSAEPLIGPWPEAVDLTGIHWMIVGGESGTDFRPMPHEWARDIGRACKEQGVAFFFKQSAAPRTEMGTSLKHSDGRFWKWEQFPGEMVKPVQAEPHKYTYDDLVNTPA